MKVKKDYILREIAGEYLLIPVGEAALSAKGLIALTESSCMLYKLLQEDRSREELLSAILKEYDVAADTAAADLDAFLNQMRALGMLLEDKT